MAGDFEDLTVVIPTLNEAEAIGKVIDEVLGVGVPRERVLVVDGGSSDGTVEIARGRGVRVIPQEGRGKADAIKTALKFVDTDYVLVMDGDWTYPARFIPKLYEKIKSEGLDMVIGVRRWGRGSQRAVFRLGNWALTRLFNMLFGTRLRDVLSGMYIVKVEALRDALFESRGFGIESEIAAHIASTSRRIGEVNVEYRRRIGRKKLGVLHGFRIAWDMIRLSWSYNPAFTLFIIGAALLLIPGLFIGAYTYYRYIAYGAMHHLDGLIAVILTASGVVSLLLAIQSLYLKRLEFRLRSLIEEALQSRNKRGHA